MYHNYIQYEQVGQALWRQCWWLTLTCIWVPNTRKKPDTQNSKVLPGIPRVSRAEDTVSSAVLTVFTAQVEQCHPSIDGYITRARNLELNTVLPSSLIQKSIALVCVSTLQWLFIPSAGTKGFLSGPKVPLLSLQGIITSWRGADGAESSQVGVIL